jgi:hypothetical protein
LLCTSPMVERIHRFTTYLRGPQRRNRIRTLAETHMVVLPYTL